MGATLDLPAMLADANTLLDALDWLHANLTDDLAANDTREHKARLHAARLAAKRLRTRWDATPIEQLPGSLGVLPSLFCPSEHLPQSVLLQDLPQSYWLEQARDAVQRMELAAVDVTETPPGPTLTEAEQKVLAAIMAAGKATDTDDIVAKCEPIGVSTVKGALGVLYRHDLVTKKKHGKRVYYEARRV